MAICGRTFAALLRRNFIYRKRRWLPSIFEFVLPAAALGILVAIKVSLEDTDGFSPETVEPTFPDDNLAFTPFSFKDYVTALRADRVCVAVGNGGDDFWISGIDNEGYNWPVPFVNCDSRECEAGDDGKSAANYCEYKILALAPSSEGDAFLQTRVDKFKTYIEERYPLVTSDELPFEFDFVQTFPSDEAIEDYVTDRDYGTSGKPKIGFAVVLTGSSDKPKAYEYTLRVNSTNFNAPEEEARPVAQTTPPTDKLFDNFAKNDRESCETEGGTPELGPLEYSCTGQYTYNGAIPIQRLVDDWIMSEVGATMVAENGVTFLPFPTKEYVENGFYASIAPYAPLLVVLGLMYPVAASIRAITQEKELRQKELLKMMSVTEADIGLSWFVSLYSFSFLSSIVTAIVTNVLYSNSEFFFLFLFWAFAFLGCLMFSFVVAAISSKSTRATLIGLLFFFIGYFLALSVDYEDGSSGLISLVSLHPVAALSYGLQVIGALEDAGVGITSNTFNSSDLPSGYTFNDALGSLIGDSILWGLLSWYLVRVIPADFGQPLKWYFPFSRTYWCPGRAHATGAEEFGNIEYDSSIPAEAVSDALKEQEKEGKSVEIRKLTKQFGEKTAVDGLNLSMYSGQVTALLGHNGAGKTTTIGMLTGMIAPTSGHAMVAGNDIKTQLAQMREEVGICLQHDCLFPLLTVREHIEFFARIKGMYAKKSRKEADDAVMTAIQDVALLEKRNTFSKDLSGGMKRKLSVAIAFCGDSKVVFLDEPTSGMDPFSRRFTWNVIRQYRQDRCIVLTTHFMDEADLLGDRIAIMAEGRLRCVGSPLFLKKSYGVGYQLTIEKNPPQGKNNRGTDEQAVEISMKKDDENETTLADVRDLTGVEKTLENIVKGAVSEAKILSNVGTEMSFQLPLGSSENFIPMFEELDNKVSNGEIVTYGVGITTLDEVFLMVARGEQGRKAEFASSLGASDLKQISAEPDLSKSHRSKMDLESGNLFSRHVQALFAKRAMNFKRDKKAWVCSTICPSMFALFGFVIVAFAAPSRNMESLTLSLDENNVDVVDKAKRNPMPFNDAGGVYSCQPGRCVYQQTVVDEDATGESYFFCGASASIGDDSVCTISESNDIVDQISEYGAFPLATDVSTILESSKSVYATSDDFEASQYGALFFKTDSSSIVNNLDGTPTYNEAVSETCKTDPGDYTTEDQCSYFEGIGYVVNYNYTSLHSSLLFQAVADEAIIQEETGDTEFSISATVHPLPITHREEGYAQAEDSFSAWFLLVLSFPFITGAFATFVVAERMSKAKHLQTVAGVNPSAYWLSTYFWDILNYQLPLWIVVILMYAIGIDAFTTTNRDVAGGTIITLLLFGPAAAGFTYIISFMFKSPSMCNLFVIVFNFLIGMAGPLVTLILRLVAENPDGDNSGLKNTAIIIEWVLRFFPSFNLGKALFFIIQIELFESIEGEPITVWNPTIILYEVTFLAWQSVVYVLIAIQIDILSTKPKATQRWRSFVRFMTCRCSGSNSSAHDPSSGIPDDEDVVAESDRVQSGEANEDLIVLDSLTKVYPNGKMAVNNMSLGIPPSECFGLLGINGAGKTTTMAMLTAEFPPTSGDATLAGFSVTSEPEHTRRRIGYCPQFDAHFMNMTGREHVELYASIKGVPKDAVKAAAAAKLAEVGLSEFDSDRLSAQYSGGMKRKLSVACATIGQPQIVFLDEPSTGMDPVARRDLWQVISNMVQGDSTQEFEEKTSVILTTHSMEECEALCPRIGIMAGGKLRCLGSAQHLKTRFGRGYQVEMKINEVVPEDEDVVSTELSLLSFVGVSGEVEENDVEASQTQSIALEKFMNVEKAKKAVESLTGDDYLSSMISPTNPTGYVVFKNASSAVGVPIAELAAFCVKELRVRNLLKFFEESYPSSILRERQDNKIRYEVSSDGLKISSLFAMIEENKEKLNLSDYGVSQTSLEQVFNMHAAEAEKAKHNTVDN